MDAEIVIIGAGVVGLAISRELSSCCNEVFVIEKHNRFGQETSSRNSEVIHSGIYYPKGSLKARLCVEGKKYLYDYCQLKEIPHKKCGKLVISQNPAQDEELKSILETSKQNGVTDGQLIGPEEVKKLEPNIIARMALLFPSTGIIDSHSLMKQFERDTDINSGKLIYGSEVVGIRKEKKGYSVTIKDQSGQYTFTATTIINSAGLFADEIARMAGTYVPEYNLHFWKGEYFSVGNGKGRNISRLIYPTPHSNHTGLGIHATLDLNNRLKLGPNALFLNNKTIDYSVDKSQLEQFYKAVQGFLPFVEKDDLEADQAGIRPKLQKPGDPVKDFIIQNEESRGFPGFINLIGIESPGLTSCMAIAKQVKSILHI